MSNEAIDRIGDRVERRYRDDRRLLTFGQFMDLFVADPYPVARNSVQYLRDAIESFGADEVETIGGRILRWCLFEGAFGEDEGERAPPVVGQEDSQRDLVEAVFAAAREGRLDRMLVLHGPNGSGKSSLIELLQRGLEAYSHSPDGALYALRWIFPKATPDESGLGFGRKSPTDDLESFALLPPDEVASRIVCELKDNPLFVIPDSERETVLETALERSPERRSESFRTFLTGNLSPKSKTIYEGLLAAYKGDWKKVVRHVQVERIFVSRRFRMGAVVTQPQGTADAKIQPITGDAAAAGLPAFLQSVPIYEVLGDLPDANRGLLEFSDFLKRNLELSKYLLQTTEKGFVTVANQLVELDIVFAATVNELHLESFKQIGEFASFQGRMTFVRVPYIREIHKEEKIYQRICDDLARSHEVAPHVSRALALFAVLTRLHRPEPENYPDTPDTLIESLTPLEKAWLYDEGRVPDRLSPDEGRELLRLLPALRDEYTDDPQYEGRYGASVRDLRAVLLRVAASNKEFVGLRELVDELAEMIRQTSVYQFLQLEPEGPYHDAEILLASTIHELSDWVTEDVQIAMELVPESEYERQFDTYFRHLVAHTRGESVVDPATGAGQPADTRLLTSIESHFPITGSVEDYRRSLMSRLASYAVENRGEQPVLRNVFPELFRALRTRFHAQQKDAVVRVVRHMLLQGRPDFDDLTDADRAEAERTSENLRGRGYVGGTLQDALAFLLDALESGSDPDDDD